MLITDITQDAKSRIQPSIEVDESDLQIWLKRHYLQAVTTILKYNSSKFSEVIEIPFLDGVQEYQLPQGFRRILRVNFNFFKEEDNKLYAADAREIDFRQISHLGGDNQEADGYRYYLRDKNIGVYPKPKYNLLANIRIWYAYEPEFNDNNFNFLPTDIQLKLSDGIVAEYLSQDNQYGASINQMQTYKKELEVLCQEFALGVDDGPKNLIAESVRTGRDKNYLDKNPGLRI